jgi:hypothetical protein
MYHISIKDKNHLLEMIGDSNTHFVLQTNLITKGSDFFCETSAHNEHFYRIPKSARSTPNLL